MGSQRLAWIDNAKMFAMFCVVFCHTLALIESEFPCRHELLALIVAFNMPLFVFLSGYTSVRSLSSIHTWADYRSYVWKIVCRLLIPTLVVGLLKMTVTLNVHNFGNTLWFLKMMFRLLLIFSSVEIVTVSLVALLKRSRQACAADAPTAGHPLLTLTQYALFVALMFATSKTKLPEFAFYFLFGFTAAKHDLILLIQQRLRPATSLLTAAALIALGLWLHGLREGTDFYHNPFYVLLHAGRIHLYFIRQLCGLLLTLAFVVLFLQFGRRYTRWSLWGTKTLGLYIVHTFLLETFLNDCVHLYLSPVQGVVAAVVLPIPLTAVSLGIIALLERWKYTNRLILGNR